MVAIRDTVRTMLRGWRGGDAAARATPANVAGDIDDAYRDYLREIIAKSAALTAGQEALQRWVDEKPDRMRRVAGMLRGWQGGDATRGGGSAETDVTNQVDTVYRAYLDQLPRQAAAIARGQEVWAKTVDANAHG
jgi:hypothetical protein